MGKLVKTKHKDVYLHSMPAKMAALSANAVQIEQNIALHFDEILQVLNMASSALRRFDWGFKSPGY